MGLSRPNTHQDLSEVEGENMAGRDRRRREVPDASGWVSSSGPRFPKSWLVPTQIEDWPTHPGPALPGQDVDPSIRSLISSLHNDAIGTRGPSDWPTADDDVAESLSDLQAYLRGIK